jgi:hypothetical protein
MEKACEIVSQNTFHVSTSSVHQHITKRCKVKVNVKVNLYSSLTKHEVVKTYGGVEVYLHVGKK